MKCNEACELTSHYIDQCLSPRECEEYEAHIEKCAECAGELEATREMVAALRLLCEPSPVDCWPCLREKLEARPRRSWIRWSLRPVFAAPMLGALLALAAFVFWPGGMTEAPGMNPASLPDYNLYVKAHSGMQQRQAFVDPDVTLTAAELEVAGVASDTSEP